jgi:hypothetical protein
MKLVFYTIKKNRGRDSYSCGGIQPIQPGGSIGYHWTVGELEAKSYRGIVNAFEREYPEEKAIHTCDYPTFEAAAYAGFTVCLYTK